MDKLRAFIRGEKGEVQTGGWSWGKTILSIFVVMILLSIFMPLLISTMSRGTNNMSLSEAYQTIAEAGSGLTQNLNLGGHSVTNGSIDAPTGRTATYVIAASGATALEKAQADMVVSGTADDEINAAISILDTSPSGSGIIYLSSGNFTLANKISFPSNPDFASGITLQGSGWASTVILQPTATYGIEMANGARGHVIKDLQLDGVGGISLSGIHYVGGTSETITYISNVMVTRFAGHGVFVDGDGISVFADRVISRSNNDGFYTDIAGGVTHTSGSHWVSCWAEYNTNYGWYVRYNEESTYSGIWSDQNGGTGFYANNSNLNINEVVLQDNTGYGFHAVAGAIVLENGVIRRNGKAGVNVEWCYDADISSLTIVDNDQSNAEVYKADVILDSGARNRVHDCTLLGIASGGGHSFYNVIAHGCTGAMIYNNRVTGASGLNAAIVADAGGSLHSSSCNNQGFIITGEIRTAKVTFTGGAQNTILCSWHNPEAQDIYIMKVVGNVTALDADAANIDWGIADNATYVNGGTEFFNDLAGETVKVNDSWLAGDGGAQTKWVLCQDSASATDGWVVAKILDADGTSITGTGIIQYCGA